jgi:hypothetical protein
VQQRFQEQYYIILAGNVSFLISRGDYPAKLDHVNDLVDRIQQRGGQVIFVRMPTDKLIWKFDNKSYPRDEFWDIFASNTSAALTGQEHVSSV